MLNPIRLFGLENCSFCEKARSFLIASQVSFDAILSNGDPIITEGVIKLTGKNEFPVLLSRITNEIITGWKPEEYERVVKVYRALYGAGASNLSVDGKPVVQETPVPSAPAESAATTA